MHSVMSSQRGRRISVELPHALAEALEREAENRSSVVRRVTISDVVREALARFFGLDEGDGA